MKLSKKKNYIFKPYYNYMSEKDIKYIGSDYWYDYYIYLKGLKDNNRSKDFILFKVRDNDDQFHWVKMGSDIEARFHKEAVNICNKYLLLK